MDLEHLISQLTAKLSSSQFLLDISLSLVKIILVILIGKYLLKALYFLIERLFKERAEDDVHTNQRNITLQAVAKSGLRYLIYFITGTIILELIGVPTTSVLAGAGVLGLAIGFGAQSLVTDVITGFFILFESQFAVGDYIQTSNVEGIVEEIGLRITKIKNFDGDLHIIPNGSITQVTNLSANSRRALVDAAIDYDQNIKEAISVLEDLCAELKEEYSDILTEGPQVLGVQELAGSSVNIRIIAMVEAMETWKMNRIIRQRIKERFDEEGIDIPYDHLAIIKKSPNGNSV